MIRKTHWVVQASDCFGHRKKKLESQALVDTIGHIVIGIHHPPMHPFIQRFLLTSYSMACYLAAREIIE